jgi:hypothetical protein
MGSIIRHFSPSLTEEKRHKELMAPSVRPRSGGLTEKERSQQYAFKMLLACRE